MTKTKFTRGPWEIFLTGDERAIYIGTDLFGENSSVAATVDVDIYGKESENLANANLISAAPELYEALDDLTEIANRGSVPDYVRDAINTAKRALAKARGEA